MQNRENSHFILRSRNERSQGKDTTWVYVGPEADGITAKAEITYGNIFKALKTMLSPTPFNTYRFLLVCITSKTPPELCFKLPISLDN